MKRILPFLIALSGLLPAQNFSEYRMRYDSFEENDERALPYVQSYLKKAKAERNFPELFQAYKDAVYFAPNGKLAYADSAVATAVLTGKSELIANGHITKGTVLYFNYRKFQPALDEYLKAWEFTKETENQYLHFKTLYHIGVIKSYLGYYEEAFGIFKKCVNYYESPQISPEPPNVKHNRKKGHLNSLHQQANCLLALNRISEAEPLIERGLRESTAQSDFYFERSCFFKLRGIAAYRKGLRDQAFSDFQTALPGFLRKNDFTNASIVYYYLGMLQSSNGDAEKSAASFAKVDSIFTKYSFLLPEVRASYEKLIDYYQTINNKEREHYYTLQLLKADQVLSSDFRYLSGKINKEYDTGDLLASKARLEHSVSRLYTLIWCVSVVFMLVVLGVFYREKSRTWLVQLLRRPKNSDADPEADNSDVKRFADTAHVVPEAIEDAVLKKLKVLEGQHFYLETGMTLQKLAPMLNTNTNYLRIIIKNNRGCSYTTYLKEQRIHYVAKMLKENKNWRSMKIEHLANACGFRDRTNFNDAFFEYYHVRPLEYIEQIRREKTEQHAP